MNTLNKIFDKIYVISSYTTQNRLNYLIPFLNNESIKYELVIAPKKKYFKDLNDNDLWVGTGAFSLLSANESILLKEYYLKSDTFCVIEDDIFFNTNYKTMLETLFANLPTDWEIINLGYHAMSNIDINTSKSYHKLGNNDIFGTHIVAYKNKVVFDLLNKLEGNQIPIDLFLLNEIYPKYNSYTCMDKIFYASSYREYETDKNAFYKKYKSEINK